MQNLQIFIDGSVHAQSKLGYGAYLVVAESGLEPAALQQRVRVKSFAQTSSTRLELQTLLWVLNEVPVKGNRLIIHTDSQNILGLPDRRARLERMDYRSSKGRLLNNHDLYREFYLSTAMLNYELVKVRGHLPSARKEERDKLFALVDRASRKALRDATASTDSSDQD